MLDMVLIMHRKAIAQELMAKLKGNKDISLIYEPDYSRAMIAIADCNAKAALIEAAEAGLYGMDYCLTLCKKIREEKPYCKLFLMCSEQDEGSIKQVVGAKGHKLIDDFVFYDVTIDYLASKLISI